MVGQKIALRAVDDIDFFNQNKVIIVGYPAGSAFDFGRQMWRSRGEFLFGQRNRPDGDYVAIGLSSGHAKLRYRRGEPNLMSLTSPFFDNSFVNELRTDQAYHRFA